MIGRSVASFHLRAAELPRPRSEMSTTTPGCPPNRPGYPHGPKNPRADGVPEVRLGPRRASDRSVGVDQLADRGNLPPELIVDGRLAGDLVAGMKDRGVVAATQLGADP